jgi:hypothetical protein
MTTNKTIYEVITNHDAMKILGTHLLNSIAIMLLITLFSFNSYAVDIVRLQLQQNSENKAAHNTEVIRRALEVTESEFGAFRLDEVNITMSSARMLQSLIDGKLFNTVIVPESDIWDKHTISVKVPVRLGLLSYRLLLINKSDLSKFEKISTLDELKTLPVGLHKGWVTTKLFNLNAFNVIETGHFEGLFLMLNRHRFDYIPRGVYEVYDELASRQDILKNIVVEPTIALFIPTMSYVNVSPTSPKIAKRLASGLLKLQNNGELKKILNKYYGKDIKRANLKNRKIFEINNSNFTSFDKLNYEMLLEDFNN